MINKYDFEKNEIPKREVLTGFSLFYCYCPASRHHTGSLDSTFFPYHTIRISFNGKGSLCSAMHISHGIIIKGNFARCLPAFYGSGLSLKGMLLRVTCFIAHQPGTPRGLTLTLRLNEK